MITKKSGKKAGKPIKMGKGQGKYLACHDQYFFMMEKSKINLENLKKITQLC